MSERHDEFRDLCALYVLGSLEPREQALLEAHLRTGCSGCEEEIAACSEGGFAIAASAARDPDPELRGRVLQAIAVEPGPAAAQRPRPVPPPPPEPRRDRRFVRFPVIAALGWAAALAAAFVGHLEQRAVRRLEREMTALRDEQSRLETRLAEERLWGTSMASPAARTAVLAPTGAGRGEISGWALYDPSSQRAIVVLENLQLEPGHDFELWAIGPQGPRSLGVIQVETGGRALVRLTRVVVPADLAAFAVSYEASGGSPNPTAPAGPVVLAGSI